MRQLRKHFPAVWAVSLTLMFTFVEVTGPSRRDGELVRIFSGGYRDCAHTSLSNTHHPTGSTNQAWGNRSQR